MSGRDGNDTSYSDRGHAAAVYSVAGKEPLLRSSDDPLEHAEERLFRVRAALLHGMVRLPKDMPVPLEDDEQIAVVEYLEARGLKFTAIPNSTFTTSMAVKNRNTRLGLRAGLPDLVIVLPLKGLLWIEMKRKRGGVVSDAQHDWHDTLDLLPGNAAHICYGAGDAITVIESYLAG